ncbi:cytochrome-c peroxidase [Changchengzhania lutea]|uniref:cytochrome-c peroxidase n=1 Tax=Changchengzhania lutea TaxID=2049305 RepID=UPI00115E1C98|nr:cytochrome c peroxidase [Changchengzhania lutea]
MKHTCFLKVIVLGVFFTLSSCVTDQDDYVNTPVESNLEKRLAELYGSKSALILPASNDFSKIPSDANNPITQAKVELGKFLFHETALGENPKLEQGRDTYSCASCHHADAGFQSGIIQGIGEGGIGFGIKGEGRIKSTEYREEDLDMQPIRSPSILNTAYQDVMLWNGQFGAVGTNAGTEASWKAGTPIENNTLGFEGLETQAIAGIEVHRMVCDPDFVASSPYKDLFDNAFPNTPIEDRYTRIKAGLAIAAYERTVLSNQAPFQDWLKGDYTAMAEEEIEGAMLFFDKGQCYSCHSGPGLNGMEFHALGMNDLAGPNVLTVVNDATKRGRGGFTGKSEDDYKFKTPQLYNLNDVNFFGHGGSFTSVEAIVRYKNKARHENNGVPSDKLSPKFEPLNLDEAEIHALTLFIEKSLYDPYLSRYKPERLPSGFCFPNADSQSSLDMGCN